MYILHIETSTSVCSVALSQGAELLSYSDMSDGMNHTALLTPAIDDILKAHALRPSDIAAISVSSGPGSYTGLRVGSSVAKAMAYSLSIPILAVPTLSSLAHMAFEAYPDALFALPMLDARRREVFTALYNRSGEAVWPVSSVILDEKFFLEQLPEKGLTVTCGDGSLKIGALGSLSAQLHVDVGIQCSARNLVSIAWDLFEGRQFQEALHYVPYYMKPPNITVSKQAGFA